MTMRHLFGPILSRRLGHSLGINLVPRKTCNYSCVYCQLGATGKTTGEIREHVPLEEVKEDLELFFSKPHPETDILTLIGDGEPLLFSPLGELVDFIKERYSLPTALITNGSLLALEERRRACKRVDLLLPTLDTVVEETWRKINRPWEGLSLEAYLEGLLLHRREMEGRMWAEVMVVAGVNDNDRELELLAAYLDRLRPDRIFLNLPVRPPAESWVKSPGEGFAERIRRWIPGIEGLGDEGEGKMDPSLYDTWQGWVRAVALSHPVTVDLLAASSRISPEEALERVKEMERRGEVLLILHAGKTFVRGV